MFYWKCADERYGGWHIIVSASDEDKAREIAFGAFANRYGEQAAFFLDFDPEKIVEGDGAIEIVELKRG